MNWHIPTEHLKNWEHVCVVLHGIWIFYGNRIIQNWGLEKPEKKFHSFSLTVSFIRLGASLEQQTLIV